MGDVKTKDGLPLIPGLTFPDVTKTRFHVSHQLDYKNGFQIPRSVAGIGRDPRDKDSCQYYDVNAESCYFDPCLIYGRTKGPAFPQFKPHFAIYDKKCLTYHAFFRQGVFESPDEYYRIRPVNIIYFLEDDTITVIEPKVDNAGFPQGRVIRRNKIPKCRDTYWHWKDLNVGVDIELYGIVFHTVSCDWFTREYMLSQGMDIGDTEEMPPDPYLLMRLAKNAVTTRKTPVSDDRLRRFLEFDGKVLRFRVVWDDRDSEYGDLKSYCMSYYLADDTVEVAELKEEREGKDPFPLLLKKQKLPKNWKEVPVTYPSMYSELSDAEVTEYYQPKDFIVGNTIYVLGRRMLIHRTDAFTRNYFCKALNIKQPDNFEVKEKPAKKPQPPPPPHTGIGALDDSLQSCLMIDVKRPKADEIKLILNSNKWLRYTAKMISTHPEDETREFIINYNLANSKIKIMEKQIRNSGISGGKYLALMLVPKPGTHPDFPLYYSPADFHIGALIHIFGRIFKITGADLAVYRYMQANPEKFTPETVATFRNFMTQEGLLKDDINTVSMIEQPKQSETCNPDDIQHTLAGCIPDKADPAPLVQPEVPPECFDCLSPAPCGRQPPCCDTRGEPEAFLDPLSGKMEFNRNYPHWK